MPDRPPPAPLALSDIALRETLDLLGQVVASMSARLDKQGEQIEAMARAVEKTRSAAKRMEQQTDPAAYARFIGTDNTERWSLAQFRAYAEPFFYVTGSHGCTRGKRRYKLSSMILTRLRPNADGTAAAETVSTYRLFDALMASAPVRDSVLRDLEFDWNALPPEGTPQPNGLNVEGLAVVGGRLYAGLRAPSLAGKAFLVSVPVEALFADENAALSAEIGTIPLEAGPDAGVRDLTILPDGRMLVLTGSSRNGLPVPFRLSLVDLPSGALTPVATLTPVRGENEKGKVIDGKAEAVVPLGSGRVLVLFDSLRNGAPHAYAVPIPERGAPTPP